MRNTQMQSEDLNFMGTSKYVMELLRVTKQTVEFYRNWSKAKTETVKNISTVKEDFDSAGLKTQA